MHRPGIRHPTITAALEAEFTIKQQSVMEKPRQSFENGQKMYLRLKEWVTDRGEYYYNSKYTEESEWLKWWKR